MPPRSRPPFSGKKLARKHAAVLLELARDLARDILSSKDAEDSQNRNASNRGASSSAAGIDRSGRGGGSAVTTGTSASRLLDASYAALNLSVCGKEEADDIAVLLWSPPHHRAHLCTVYAYLLRLLSDPHQVDSMDPDQLSTYRRFLDCLSDMLASLLGKAESHDPQTPPSLRQAAIATGRLLLQMQTLEAIAGQQAAGRAHPRLQLHDDQRKHPLDTVEYLWDIGIATVSQATAEQDGEAEEEQAAAAAAATLAAAHSGLLELSVRTLMSAAQKAAAQVSQGRNSLLEAIARDESLSCRVITVSQLPSDTCGRVYGQVPPWEPDVAGEKEDALGTGTAAAGGAAAPGGAATGVARVTMSRVVLSGPCLQYALAAIVVAQLAAAEGLGGGGGGGGGSTYGLTSAQALLYYTSSQVRSASRGRLAGWPPGQLLAHGELGLEAALKAWTWCMLQQPPVPFVCYSRSAVHVLSMRVLQLAVRSAEHHAAAEAAAGGGARQQPGRYQGRKQEKQPKQQQQGELQMHLQEEGCATTALQALRCAALSARWPCTAFQRESPPSRQAGLKPFASASASSSSTAAGVGAAANVEGVVSAAVKTGVVAAEAGAAAAAAAQTEPAAAPTAGPAAAVEAAAAAAQAAAAYWAAAVPALHMAVTHGEKGLGQDQRLSQPMYPPLPCAALQAMRVVVPQELEAHLPPSPPPNLAAALSAGYLPLLERAVRAVGRNMMAFKNTSPVVIAGYSLQVFTDGPLLLRLLAYSEPSAAASLMASGAKLVAQLLLLSHLVCGLGGLNLDVVVAVMQQHPARHLQTWLARLAAAEGVRQGPEQRNGGGGGVPSEEEGEVQAEEASGTGGGAGGSFHTPTSPRSALPPFTAAVTAPGPTRQLLLLAASTLRQWLPATSALAIKCMQQEQGPQSPDRTEAVALSVTDWVPTLVHAHFAVEAAEAEVAEAVARRGLVSSSAAGMAARLGVAAGISTTGCSRSSAASAAASAAEDRGRAYSLWGSLLLADMDVMRLLGGMLGTLAMMWSQLNRSSTVRRCVDSAVAALGALTAAFPDEVAAALRDGTLPPPLVVEALVDTLPVGGSLASAAGVRKKRAMLVERLRELGGGGAGGSGDGMAAAAAADGRAMLPNPIVAGCVEARASAVGALLAAAVDPAEVAGLLRAQCANLGCTNFAGDIDARLMLLWSCNNCGRERYCSEGCRDGHWRTGHREECGRRRD